MEPLISLSVEEQLTLRDADPVAFHALALNDERLKSYIRTLEQLVAEHDELLGGCGS